MKVYVCEWLCKLCQVVNIINNICCELAETRSSHITLNHP